MDERNIVTWSADWGWSLPLIVVTVVMHVFGLSIIRQWIERVMPYIKTQRKFSGSSRWAIGAVALCVTVLHSVEAALWAATFLFLGALPNARTAMLYSLNAITAFGHVNLYLADRWQLMGSLEALNGWILFGLSTAFLFGLIERLWSHAPDSALVYKNSQKANAAD